MAAVALSALAAAAAPQALSSTTPTPPGARPQDAGAPSGFDLVHAKATFQALCSKCHDLGPVNAQNHDRAGWQEVIERMNGFGLVASDEEREEVLSYLAATRSTPQ